MLGGLFVSTFVGVVMASAAVLNGHGFWWALFNYSAGGTLTFLFFLALILRFSQKDDGMSGPAKADLPDGLYRVVPVSFKRGSRDTA